MTNRTNCVFKNFIEYRTPSRNLKIEKFETILPLNNVTVDKEKFNHLCKIGCVNYDSKYSCPPKSPSFEKHSAGCTEIQLFLYRIFLFQYQDVAPYNRIRASNSILKSILDKELLDYKLKGFKVVGSGSCRACKPCGAKTGLPCKKPEKLIYSLESLGVNVNRLVKDAFGFDLQWYKKGKEQDFTSAVGGVLL